MEYVYCVYFVYCDSTAQLDSLYSGAYYITSNT